MFIYLQGINASGEVEHERVGEVYTTLVGLLKAKSKHFATTIGKQVISQAILCHSYKLLASFPHYPWQSLFTATGTCIFPMYIRII